MKNILAVILTFMVLTFGISTAMAQEQTQKMVNPGAGTMMWSGMVGPGMLHAHMDSMIMQMSGMVRMMSRMMESGKMDEKNMKYMSEMMEEISNMMTEIPAVQTMMDKQPDLAMKDMGKMTKTMSELMEKMAGMIAQTPK